MNYVLGKSKKSYTYQKHEMNKLFAQKWKMILLKYQGILSQEEGKDTNQCVIIVTFITSDHGSTP